MSKHIAEFRTMSSSELVSKLDELKKESMNLRFQLKLKADFENTARIKFVRRQTARVLTVIREMEAI